MTLTRVPYGSDSYARPLGRLPLTGKFKPAKAVGGSTTTVATEPGTSRTEAHSLARLRAFSIQSATATIATMTINIRNRNWNGINRIDNASLQLGD
jgi:hypothetical protein